MVHWECRFQGIPVVGVKESDKGVNGLGERTGVAMGKGSGRGAGIGAPGSTAEKSGDNGNSDSVPGAVEIKGHTEGIASPRASGNSRQLTSAVVLLLT